MFDAIEWSTASIDSKPKSNTFRVSEIDIIWFLLKEWSTGLIASSRSSFEQKISGVGRSGTKT